MFSRIEFILTEVFLSTRRHPMMAFAATTCIAATLFVAGIVTLALLNANYAVGKAMDQVRFVVYFHPDPQTTREEARAAYKRILAMDGVESAEFVSKESAWKKLKQDNPDYANVLERNYFPDSVTIKAASLEEIPGLMKEIRQWSEVHKVRHEEKVTSFLETAQRGVRNVGAVMGIILLLLSLVIIHHTIELTLYARRKEIHIMSLVGASPSTVAMPFLLEGALYGLFGGGFAFGFLALLYNFVRLTMRQDYGARLFDDPQLMSHGITVIIAAGVVLGLIGSIISVLKYLHSPKSRLTNA